MAWASDIADMLWRSAWTVIPLVLLVAAICRWARCQPGTRHALWVIVLASFFAPLLAPFVPLPELPKPAVPPSQHDQTSAVMVAEPVAALPIVAESADGKRQVAPSPPAPSLVEPAASHISLPETAQATQNPRCALSPNGPARVGNGPIGIPSAGTGPGPVACAPDSDWERTVAQGHLVLTPTRVLTETLPDCSGDKISPASSSWRVWIVAMVGVRDALTDLPTLPTGLWCVGIGALVAVYTVGTIRFRRRLRRAVRAPRSVERLVASVARKLGLRRVPETLMLSEPISPLVWCGRRARLVLPLELWSQLDRVGHRAILCHELAHLRRRDHWVRWLELLISVVFWWHPLAWWVRRRVHEEADLCCDAWVTWLMPRRRRAYAEALLTTREHTGVGCRVTPAAAMGATSSGAKPFARRITMIMTRNSRPGMSRAGIGLACLLAVVGWVATPAWSSPPDKKCRSRAATDCGKACDKARGTDCGKDCGEACDKRCGEKKVRLERLRAGGSCGDKRKRCGTIVIGDDGAASSLHGVRRIRVGDDDLNRKLAKLEAELSRMSEQLSALRVDVHLPAIPALPALPARPARRAPRIHAVPHATSIALGQHLAPLIAIAEDEALHEVHEGGVVARSYKLPEGKLEQLTELMIRSDVPVLVRPGEDEIEVHATPAQHRVFRAFIELIHPSGKGLTEVFEVRPGGVTIIGDHAKAYTKALQSYAHAKDVLQDTVSADRVMLYALGEEGEIELSDLGVDLSDLDIELPDFEVVVPTVEVAVIEDVNELLEELNVEVLAGTEEIKLEAKELRERARACKDGKFREAKEIHRAIRELQRQAREFEKMARELERKADRLSDEAPEL